MINLDQLYRQVIMDNYKNPKNKGLVEGDGYVNVHLKNPSCGDDMYVCCKVVDNIVVDVKHMVQDALFAVHRHQLWVNY